MCERVHVQFADQSSVQYSCELYKSQVRKKIKQLAKKIHESQGLSRNHAVPLFQSESKCKAILIKMTLICMKMKLYAELIFIRMVSQLDSF